MTLLALALTLVVTPPHPHAPSSDSTLVPYVVRHGDTLWSVSQRFYGNGRWWTVIVRDTPRAVVPTRLHAGQILAVRLHG